MAVETERLGIHQSNNNYAFGHLNSSPMVNMHSDAMDDYDMDSASKAGGRSGRRKQSKPIRVFLDSDGTEIPEAGQAAPTTTTESEPLPLVIKPDLELADEECITCDLCNATFETQSDLTDHIENVHQIDDDDNQENFPTKYHQLGNEFQQELSPPGHGKDSTKEEEVESRSALLPKPAFSNGGDPNSRFLMGEGRKPASSIFHLDAYCELCDREFCNKYFLKTHKANMHKIFDSPRGSPTSLPALIPLDGEAVSSHDGKPIPGTVKNITKLIEESSRGSGSSPKHSPPPSAVSSLSSLMTSASSALEKRASSKLDMEDYCELCQKHFCNKYYLKKHKQDVHGIVPEDTPGAKRARPSHNSSPLSVSSASHLPQNASPSAVNGNGAIPGLSNMANVMFINPFGPPLALLQPQQLGGFPGLPGLPLMPQSIPGAQSPKTSLPSSLSPPSGFPLPGDHLRNLGLLSNQDAICEICKKEFVNKYFLNIHKASKHGASDMPLMFPGMPGIPDNLPLGPNGKELGELALKKESSESSDDGREFCDVCKKEFPNEHHLKVHLITEHGQRLSEFDLLPELSKAESISAGLTEAMFNSMMAAKKADRVICDLCNKEVCNKYFLRTHKIKVHNIDPAQLDRESSPQPPMSLVSLSSHHNTPPSLSFSMPPTSLSLPMPPKDVPIPPPSDPVPRPSDSELLKMGIDPEAYCEICKKEFCSKYFLKTHKWNLHGIKTGDGTPPSGARLAPKPLSTIKERPLPMNGSPRRLPTTPNNWKWKEPANSMRVMCELCNKELCNKYFLKTHMLNKHGINIDVSAGAPGFPSNLPNPPSMHPAGFPLPPFPFPGFLKDENSNTSLPSSKQSSQNGLPKQIRIEPAQADTATMREQQLKPIDNQVSAVHPEPQTSPNVLSAKTWALPDFGTPNEDAINLTMPAKIKDEPQGNQETIQTSLLGYQSQRQGKEETIQTTDGQFSFLKCDLCGMMFGEKSTLETHMERDHSKDRDEESFSEDTSDGVTVDRSSSVTSLGLSLKRKYQFGVRRKLQHMQKLKRLQGGVSIAEKVKSAIVNHIQNHLKKKKFKCAFCQEKFSLRSLCQQHIRAKHKREVSPGMSDDSFSSKTSISGAETIMQPFNVEELQGSGQFASSVVYLPVYSKISKPISATFTLTPADH